MRKDHPNAPIEIIIAALFLVSVRGRVDNGVWDRKGRVLHPSDFLSLVSEILFSVQSCGVDSVIYSRPEINIF